MELSARGLLLAAWAAGLAFFFPILQWMRVADYRMYATWISLALYCSLFVPAGIWLIRRLDRKTGLPLAVTVPAVWTGLEYVRAHALTGFPWYFLGHTQHDFLPIIQVADLAGAYAVTFLVAAVNAVIFEWLYVWPAFRRLFCLVEPTRPWGRGLLVQSAVILIAAAAVIGYGFWRLSQGPFDVGPRVALIQGNIDQRLKNAATQDDGDQAAKFIWDHYVQLCDQAAAQRPRPDIIIWPETSWPAVWTESRPGQPNTDAHSMARWLADRWGIASFIGLNSCIEENGGRRLHNSGILITGRGEIGPRYDKMHRVPFGEYVPLRDWFSWMDRFAPYDFDYSIRPGENYMRFGVGGAQFGALICYEDTDPVLARQYVRQAPVVDFLVNISNDGWFNGTAEHEEHLAICRFRAVECRRAVARAVNMGVSAIIDGNGRVLRTAPAQSSLSGRKADVREVLWQDSPREEWSQFKKVPVVLVGDIPIDRRPSLYASLGDWLPQASWLLIGLALLWSFRRVLS
jgi:apolipoprotein N-acyltransferase